MLWSLKAIWLVVTQAKHCILLYVSMTKSLHISHILSALLQDIPSIALCMSGTLSSSSEVSICSQTESAETRHSENEREVCIMQKCNRHPALLIPSLPAEHFCAEDTRESFFVKSANEKERWYSVERRPWNTRLKAHLLVLEFWLHFSKRDEFLYQKKTGKLGYVYFVTLSFECQPANSSRISGRRFSPSQKFFGGREATTGNASAVRRQQGLWLKYICAY